MFQFLPRCVVRRQSGNEKHYSNPLESGLNIAWRSGRLLPICQRKEELFQGCSLQDIQNCWIPRLLTRVKMFLSCPSTWWTYVGCQLNKSPMLQHRPCCSSRVITTLPPWSMAMVNSWSSRTRHTDAQRGEAQQSLLTSSDTGGAVAIPNMAAMAQPYSYGNGKIPWTKRWSCPYPPSQCPKCF